MIKILIVLLVMNKCVFSETYYEILGVSKHASTQEIKQAYKKLAVKLHPDKNTDSEDQKRFLKITEAYETLKEPQKRHNYDLYGSQNSYTKKYDYHSQAEYNNLFYNGLYHDDPHVESLSGDKFYSYLNNGLCFINFYSPFCPPCQNLADDWKKLAKVYKGIVKVGAVNCKYYNTFCFNNMRISSYPSLLLYPNGKNGNYNYYKGGHSYAALEEFIVTYLRKKVNVPSIAQIRNNDIPMVYVVADDLDETMVLRMAYHLNGLAPVVMASHLRSKLTEKPETVIVFRHKQRLKEIESTDEKSIIEEIVGMLPEIEKIGLDQIKKIRNGLRRGDQTPWVLYFSKKENDSYVDRLLLHQLRMYLNEMNFGEINCDVLGSLCHSLQMREAPGWGILKPGGAYQRIYQPARASLLLAARALPLHTLSLTDYTDILKGDMSTWIVLVAPYKVAWDHLSEPFTQACIELADTGINFGIMSCTSETDSHCRLVAQNEPVIIVQNGTDRNTYSGPAKKNEIIEFIDLLKESANMELTEEQAVEIHMDTSREHTWLIAYFPATCSLCKELLHELRIVAKRLRPLEFIRVGVLDCSRYGSKGFCSNIRISTGRLYPIASGQHFTLNLQHSSEAPYILEWALDHIDDSVLKLNWQSFTKTVIAEELNPSRNKKPWLVYFHSPRCYRCYEMYPDFAIMAIMLGTNIRFGRVNCVTERGLCQHEHVTTYPSIKLYLSRNRRNSNSRVIPFQPKKYSELINDIKPHIMGYDEETLPEFENLNIKSQFPFRDEL